MKLSITNIRSFPAVLSAALPLGDGGADTRGGGSRIVVLRPGALGDVLAARVLLTWAKAMLPAWTLAWSAPGERGRLLFEDGQADVWFDWDSAALSGLFNERKSAPPELASFFADSRLILAFLGSSNDDAGNRALTARLRALAPEAAIRLLPARPPDGSRQSIYAWMTVSFTEWWAEWFGRPAPPLPPVDAFPRLRANPPKTIPIPSEPYAVVHPGSGSAAKNWGASNFAEVVRRLSSERRFDGTRLFDRVFVTSSEADGPLGGEVAAMLPGAELVEQPLLRDLAGLLAGAELFLGNDSGVTHLAAAVERPAGGRPRVAAVFGPSESAIWAPPGAYVLEAGRAMDKLDPKVAARRIADFLGNDRH